MASFVTARGDRCNRFGLFAQITLVLCSMQSQESAAMPADPPKVLRTNYPTARPAKGRVSAEVIAPVVEVAEEESEQPWFTPESIKGWASSLAVHAVLLIGLGFWWLAPRGNMPLRFDSRLAGSERGVEDGLTNHGGLNTALTIPEAPEPSRALPDPVLSSIKPFELEPLEPKFSTLVGADRASAEGGMRNDNPGAGDGDGFGLARFGQGGEVVQGVEVKVGDPQFTLIWDTKADIDLHVIEPGGKEIYWEERRGAQGGELDVDDIDGFGPENIYWLREDPATGDRVKGPGPPGEYKWFVHYYGGFGEGARLTHWKVRIKHEGKVTVVTGKLKALNERSRTYTLEVKPPPAVAGDVPPSR
jgi:hypothetical protein